ncbi:MAG: hypothetical protein RUMPE_00649 [Eubacteriales bacterium SKADARSKE-1]|nr:hypothetical protein [Eubacteriales bacterium SKADARSKE-1]
MKESDILNIKILSALSYVGPLFIIGKFAVEKNSPEVKFHSDQGKVLFSLMLIVLLVIISLDIFLTSFSESISVIFFLIYIGAGVAWAILASMGIFGVIKNKQIQLPLVYDIAKKFN